MDGCGEEVESLERKEGRFVSERLLSSEGVDVSSSSCLGLLRPDSPCAKLRRRSLVCFTALMIAAAVCESPRRKRGCPPLELLAL